MIFSASRREHADQSSQVVGRRRSLKRSDHIWPAEIDRLSRHLACEREAGRTRTKANARKLNDEIRAWNRNPYRGKKDRPAGTTNGGKTGMLRSTRQASLRSQRQDGYPTAPTIPRRREVSNQVSNNRDRQRWTSADIDGQRFPGQTCRSPGSPHLYLASGRRGHRRP